MLFVGGEVAVGGDNDGDVSTQEAVAPPPRRQSLSQSNEFFPAAMLFFIMYGLCRASKYNLPIYGILMLDTTSKWTD